MDSAETIFQNEAFTSHPQRSREEEEEEEESYRILSYLKGSYPELDALLPSEGAVVQRPNVPLTSCH